MNGSILWQKKRYHAWQHDVLRLFAGEPVTIRQVPGVEGLIIIEYNERLLTFGIAEGNYTASERLGAPRFVRQARIPHTRLGEIIWE